MTQYGVRHLDHLFSFMSETCKITVRNPKERHYLEKLCDSKTGMYMNGGVVRDRDQRGAPVHTITTTAKSRVTRPSCTAHVHTSALTNYFVRPQA
jgi:hypothetical protein